MTTLSHPSRIVKTTRRIRRPLGLARRPSRLPLLPSDADRLEAAQILNAEARDYFLPEPEGIDDAYAAGRAAGRAGSPTVCIDHDADTPRWVAWHEGWEAGADDRHTAERMASAEVEARWQARFEGGSFLGHHADA